MGRTGTTHAWEQEGTTPDIQAIGKGLGGGYVAIGGILVGRRVVDTLSRGSGSFVHGHTYQAHPVACVAALEVQKIIREQALLSNVRAMGTLLAARRAPARRRHPRSRPLLCPGIRRGPRHTQVV
jgi:adenosylmethionine-8-amino-7-oxononanoate aminotransferase